jgi:hypothetical protein
MKLILFFISLNLFSQFKPIHYQAISFIAPPLCCGGTKGSQINNDNAKNATGFGCGGGSSGWGGGWGGNGIYGGGGGGAASYQSSVQGGAGGKGAIVIEYRAAGDSPIFSEIRTNNFSVAIPTNVASIKVWSIGGGGGGAGGLNGDGNSSSGGAAEGTAYKVFTITSGTMSGTIGNGGNGGPGGGGAGGAGQTTSFSYSGITINGLGGEGGLFNNGATRNGGDCNFTGGSYDGCVRGGSAYGVTGDNPGSPGGAIGKANTTKGYDGDVDAGEDGNDSVDVSGLFHAVMYSRIII